MYKPQAQAHAMCGSTSQQIMAFSYPMKIPAATRCPAAGSLHAEKLLLLLL
jgi:hypothetical protein